MEYRRPNKNKYIDKNFVGRGFVVRRFPTPFSILLTNEYNEGTPYGKYFNQFDKNGQSTIYVSQEEIEKKILSIVRQPNDSLKYLVGFTGIGKTTLLKNLFRTFDRKAEIRNGEIIIYISFHASNLNSDKPTDSVNKIICENLKIAIHQLFLKNPDIINPSTHKEFFSEFYKSVESNKKTKIAQFDIIPGGDYQVNPSEEEKNNYLKKLREKDELGYYLFMLKFVTNMCSDIKRIIFVFDDIESQANIFHHAVIDGANHTHECLKTHKNRKFFVKTIVSLKSFTFRENMGREQIARRIDIDEDVILKEKIPQIVDIFKKRFEAAKESDLDHSEEYKESDWEEANKILYSIAEELSVNFGDLISKLSNNDIVKTLKSFVRIISNHKYVASFEKEKEGAFSILKENYNIKTSEPILKALAYGEGSVFGDTDHHMFCNILQVHNEEMPDCELLGLYVVNYFVISNQANRNTLYGTRYEVGSEVVNYITSVFPKLDENEQNLLKEKLNHVMKHLYEGGVLLRSIHDYENPNEAITQIERVYNEKYGLYLSLRGRKLFDMLSENSLLFEIYRDDIDTNIEGNDKCSCDMSTAERMLYLIKYVELLFEKEKLYLQNSDGRTNSYISLFGDNFIVCPLIEGIVRSTMKYFKQKDNEFLVVFERIDKIINTVSDYSNMLFEERNVRISLSNKLINAWNNLQEYKNEED